MPSPRRKNIRLQGYDYAKAGAYFITIVTKDREPLFGKIVDGEMVLNAMGELVDYTWKDLINHNPNIGLDEFVIMPTHIHGIIVIFDPVGAGSKPARSGGAGYEPAPTKTVPLSEIVRQLKTFSAKRINVLRGTSGVPVWQRNYYDHIIGTDHEYDQIAEYIANNPLTWETDDER